MLTADTLTDEQIRELIDDPQDREWSHSVSLSDCYVALNGEKMPTPPREPQRFTRTSDGYRRARARCAEILNARAKEQR